MTNWRDHGPVTDEDLLAYLDGMLEGDMSEYVERELIKDRALDARLELLRCGMRPFDKAYDLLLREAPKARLKQILKLAKDPPPPPVEEPKPEPIAAKVEVARSEPWGGWRKLAAGIAFLAVFSAGLITSRFVNMPGESPQLARAPAVRGWRAAVAEYQTLFVKQTLVHAGEDVQAQSENLRSALVHLGMDLSVEKVSVDPLDFKRAEVLNFKGKPLVQMAYLMHGDTPVSFCIIKGRKPVHGLKSERREGLNIVHWRSKEYGFMVIGDVPDKELGEIARKLKQQMS
jgi:anti-sigma factor RsiW